MSNTFAKENSGTESYDFTDTASSHSRSAIVFTIENTGTANLTLSVPTKRGSNETEIILNTGSTATTVSSGGKHDLHDNIQPH